MLGESYLVQNELGEAQKHFMLPWQRTALPEVVANALFQEALTLAKLKEFKQSAVLFQRFVQDYVSHPRVDEACFWLAESEYQAGEFGRARESYGKVVLEFPKSVNMSMHCMDWVPTTV